MSSFWADVLAHSAFFIGFLPIFYFTYVVPVQSNALANDFFGLVKDSLTSISLASNPIIKREIDESIQAVATKEESNPILSKLTKDNPTIFKWTMVFVGLTVPILLGLATYLQYSSGGSVFDLFLSNFIVLAFIAISEFAIVGIFVSNFVEIDKDFVKGVLFNATFSSYTRTYDCNFVYEFALSKFGNLGKKFFS
jgi:hypothetical protein